MKANNNLFCSAPVTLIFALLFSVVSFASEKKSENKNAKFEKPIVRFLPAMKSCRNPDTVSDITASGKIMIDYEINDKGSLQSLKINDEKTTLNDLNLQKCVLDVMKKIKFPKAAKGKTVSVSYAVEFK